MESLVIIKSFFLNKNIVPIINVFQTKTAYNPIHKKREFPEIELGMLFHKDQTHSISIASLYQV